MTKNLGLAQAITLRPTPNGYELADLISILIVPPACPGGIGPASAYPPVPLRPLLCLTMLYYGGGLQAVGGPIAVAYA
jgi:hypothetical protein